MQEYGPPADLWSVGMLMYQLLTGTFPFWDSVQNISLQQVCAQLLRVISETASCCMEGSFRVCASTLSDPAESAGAT